MFNHRRKLTGIDSDWIQTYTVLIQFKFKQSKMPDNIHPIRDMIAALRKAGFILMNYSLCYWSSEYDGWRVYEVDDLEKFRKTIYGLRLGEKNFVKWLDIKCSIGTSHTVPTFQVKLDKDEIRAAGQDEATMAVVVVGGEGDDTTQLTFSIVDGAGVLSKGEGNERETSDESVSVQVKDGKAKVGLTSRSLGEVKVLVSVGGDTQRGMLGCVTVKGEDAEG